MFSIIIPLYNKEKEILRTVESAIKAFRNHDYEILIVNDGSTDKSFEIVTKLSKTNGNIVIINQNNGGVSKARNTGIDASKYNYLVFLDADDYLLECAGDEYHKMISTLGDDYGIYSVGFSMSNGETLKTYDCNRALGKPEWFGEVKDPIKVISKYQGSSFIHSSAICVNKYVQSKFKIYFPEGITHTEDVSFFFDFMINSRIAYSSKLCTHYHIDASNRSCNTKPTTERYINSKIDLMISNGVIDGEKCEQAKSFVAKNYVHLCFNCIEMGNYENFKINIKKSWKYSKWMTRNYKMYLTVFSFAPFNILKMLVKFK